MDGPTGAGMGRDCGLRMADEGTDGLNAIVRD